MNSFTPASGRDPIRRWYRTWSGLVSVSAIRAAPAADRLDFIYFASFQANAAVALRKAAPRPWGLICAPIKVYNKTVKTGCGEVIWATLRPVCN